MQGIDCTISASIQGAADSRQLCSRVSFSTLNRHLSVPPALCTRRHRRLATLTCVFCAADVYEGHAPGSACVHYKNTSAPISTDASGQAEVDRLRLATRQTVKRREEKDSFNDLPLMLTPL